MKVYDRNPKRARINKIKVLGGPKYTKDVKSRENDKVINKKNVIGKGKLQMTFL